MAGLGGADAVAMRLRAWEEPSGELQLRIGKEESVAGLGVGEPILGVSI